MAVATTSACAARSPVNDSGSSRNTATQSVGPVEATTEASCPLDAQTLSEIAGRDLVAGSSSSHECDFHTSDPNGFFAIRLGYVAEDDPAALEAGKGALATLSRMREIYGGSGGCSAEDEPSLGGGAFLASCQLGGATSGFELNSVIWTVVIDGAAGKAADVRVCRDVSSRIRQSV